MKDNKDKYLKRFLAFVLSAAMVVTYMPTSLLAYAAAEDAEPAVEETVDNDSTEAAETAEEANTEEPAPAVETPETEQATGEASEEPVEEGDAPDAQPVEETEEEEQQTAGGTLTYNDTKYSVEVTLGEDSGIVADDYELVLKEFKESSKEFKAAKEALLEDELGNSPYSEFDKNATDEDLEGLGMAAFDLSIRNKETGEVKEPDGSVAVSIKLKELPEGVDAEDLASSMEIQHHDESGANLVVEKVATVDAQEASQSQNVGEIDVNTNKETAKVDFTVDSFSTYTITWSNRSYNIHYVDTNGNSLTPSRTPTFTNDPNYLIYDIPGYEYDSTHLSSRTGTAILPYIAHYNRDRYIYYTNGSYGNLRNDIYVVYKAKTNPTTGGTPAAPTGETWPEGNNAPQFSKSSTGNGNGTNTVALSIKAAEKAVEKATKANVIVVFDVSGSMSNNMNGQTRLKRAKTAVNTMADKLMATGQTKMALVSFSNTSNVVQGLTSSKSDFQNAVNNLEADGGTNWEKALYEANRISVDSDAATFIVFITDGDPTFRQSRGNVSDADLDGDISDYYTRYNVFGAGSSDSEGRNFDFAVEQIKEITKESTNKQFYAIGVSNDVTKVQTLTTQGGAPANHAFLASDADALDAAAKAITNAITSTLGFGDIEMTDGITALTNAEMKVMQTVDESSFKYYKTDAQGHKTEWTTRATDGCAPATYNKTDGAVHWDMGEKFQLENGVTYTVEFNVWPSQAAYDLVADLNNGIKTYNSLTDAEKAQVVEKTAPTATTTGTYELKTNTDTVKATYNKTTKTGETVVVSDDTDVLANYTPGPIEDMSLVSDFITVTKDWNNAIPGDERDAQEIGLTVTKDGTAYISPVTLNKDNNWTSGKEYISAGLITKANGKYNIREKGHEYTITEPEDFSYYWDLKADIYRPMVIDGTLHVLIKTDNPTGAEGTNYYVIDGKSYQVRDGQTNLHATNDRRSNLNLSKTVENNPNPNATFEYTITITDKNGSNVWFGAQDKDGNTVELPSFSTNVTPQEKEDGSFGGSYHVPSGQEFTISIKDGWNVRFFNLPTGSSYSINESDMTAGYGFASVTTDASNGGTKGTVSGNTVTGTIDKPNNIFSAAYKNNVTGAVDELEVTKNLAGRDWADGDKFEFVLTAGESENKAGEAITTPMPADAKEGKKSVTISKTTTDKTAGFGNILFPYEGTYNYTIKEVKPANPISGVVYDEKEYPVVVTVAKSGNTMAATTKYDGKDSLTVTNTLTPVKVQPEVAKTLTGRAFKDDDEYTFTIARAQGEPATTPMPKDADGKDVTTATANKASNWKAVFGEMSFNAVGEYKYTITEQKGALDGVAYNTTPIEVVVKVETNSNNELIKTVTYDSKTTASVENTFTPVKKALEVTKVLTGREWEDTDVFDFTLAAGASTDDEGKTITTPMPSVTTAQAKKNDPATAVNEEIAKFAEITFAEAGTYKYTITEQKGGLDGVTYNTTAKEVTVVVAKNADTNALSIESVTYAGGANVENTFTPSAEVPLQITKQLQGRDWEDEDSFEFTITGSTGAPMPTATTATANKADKVAQFGTVQFKKIGTYTYTIKETKGRADGITYDAVDHTITVNVTKNADNVLATEVTYDGNKQNEGLTSINTFAPTKTSIEATKKFNDWGKADKFTFELKPVGNAPMPADAVNGAKRADATQTAAANFGTIVFTKAADYKYTVTEVNTGVDGVAYDTSAHEVIVHVTKDETTNALTATVDYGKDGKLEIENTFTAAKANIEATKDFGNNDWAKAGNGFTFELKALDGAPMPAGVTGDTKTGTATESAKTVDFGEIAFDHEGTYYYTVTEQNGGKDGITYDTAAHKVAVVVSKAKDNSLSTKVYYDAEEGEDGAVTGADDLTIENKFYPVTADIDVTKNFTGRADNAWNDDDEFEFTLTPVGDAPMPAAKKGIVAKLAGLLGAEGDNTATVKVTKNSKDFTETFGTITYEKAGTYEYTITETNGKKDGITYDVATHKVVVTVAKSTGADNKLTATVTYDGDNNKLTVNNTYSSTKAQIKATKSFNDWSKADSFEFTLTPQGNAPMPADAENGKVVRTVTKDSVDAVFGEIEYLAAGEYKYTIKETKGSADGVTYDTAEHEVVVTVSKTSDEKTGTNALSAVVKYDGNDDALTITNTFASSDAVTLQATKIFKDWGKADSFTFNLKADGNAPMPKDASGKDVTTMTVTKDAPTALFGSVSFDAVGTYTYHITEVNDGRDGVSYDTTDHTIVVTVAKDADNKLTATAVYDKDASKKAVEITNTYASTTATLEATKKFNDWGKATSFTFNLEPGAATYTDGSAEGVSPMPANATGTKSATATQNSPATFGEITYEKAGTYKYTITEVNDGIDGVSYDTTPHEVVVTVTKAADASNKLTATVKYDDKTSLEIKNTYSSVTTAEPIEVTKSFNDWGKAESFTFDLAAVTEGAPMPDKTSATATKDAPLAVFGKITFEKAGKYEYTITERNGGADGVSYDTKAHKVVVNVTKADDATNALTATVKYDGADSLTVTNTYTAVKTTKPIEVTKSFNDWGKADSFTFNLAAVTEGAPLPKDADGKDVTVATATKDAPLAVFGKITFEKAGTYQYTITERNDGKDGVSYDVTPHTVTVEVKKADDATNKLTATVKYDTTKDDLTVTNTYKSVETSEAIKATKSFNDWGKAESFTFNLAAVTEGAPMPKDAQGKDVTTAVATKDKVEAVFGKITYEKAGTYEYTITEVDDGVDGVTYDTTPKTVTVTVTKADDATNALSATVKYGKEDALTVVNSFESGKATLQATKSFNDWTKAKSFTFDLAAVTKDAPMPALTEATATQQSPTAVFGEVAYTKAGTYEYTITERNGGADGVSYDTKAHKVVVTVTKGAGNKLSTDVKYDGAASLTITNEYKSVETKDSIKATKDFNDWGKADSFTFNLAAVTTGAPMPAKTQAVATKDAPVADFGKITYEKAGVYEYTITEVNDGKDGVSYDTTPHKVVVTVTKADDATNALTATVKYDGKDSLTVTNTYTAVTTEKPVEVTKDFNDWGKADSFTFDLAAVTEGAPLPDKTSATATKDAKTAQFGTITFEKAGTYEYTITERNGKADGVNYDTTAHKLTIVVEKATDATNALTVASVKYDGGDKLTVKNEYSSLEMPTESLLRVTKEIKGREWLANDKFEFTLAPADGAPMPKNVKATADTEHKTAIFDAMTFEKTGTYKYTITETDGKKGGLTYDTKSYNVTVVIGKADDATNALKVDSVTYEGKDSLTVTNKYNAEGTAEFDAQKILKGRDLAEGEFTFELKKDGVKVGEAKNDAEGKVTFTGVKFVKDETGKDETGKYTFTISEVVPEAADKLGGVTYDDTVASIAVEVTDNGDGTLAVTYDGKDKAPTPEFTNIYEAEGELVLDGLKTLEYGDLADQAFNFTVLDAEGNEVATAVAGGEGAAVTGDADTKAGTKSEFEFSAIKYAIKAGEDGEMIDETGEYTYTVKEVIPEEAVNTKTGKTYKEDPAADGIFELGNYRYDNSEKTVKVKVTDNGDGTLKVEQTEGDEVQSFTNTKAYTDIEITKDLKNYVEHDGVNEVTLAFRVVDKETKGTKFSKAAGITFTKAEVEAGKAKSITVSKIPTDIAVEITEVYASNYKADPKTVELKLVDGVYKASFTNTFDNVNYNSGVINNYKKNADGGYDYQAGNVSGN